MRISKELEKYMKDIISKGVTATSGDDAAGYANAILMVTRAWGMHIAVEQAQAVNFVSPQKGDMDGGRDKTTKN
jgi:hypothetical protein